MKYNAHGHRNDLTSSVYALERYSNEIKIATKANEVKWRIIVSREILEKHIKFLSVFVCCEVDLCVIIVRESVFSSLFWCLMHFSVKWISVVFISKVNY